MLWIYVLIYWPVVAVGIALLVGRFIKTGGKR